MLKKKIGKTQQNSKCRLCGDIYGTINHIIYEYSKLAQKDYTRLVGEGNTLEVVQKIKI